jgi:nucleoside-diphosphate-sugar epimerase
MTSKALRVAVTGASGYVGSRIARHLRASGLQVTELNRRADNGCAKSFALGAEVPHDTLSGMDALVHCAYDFSASAWEEIKRVNVEGSLKLFEAARAAGVKRVVFISTLSAFRGCASLYGRAKLAVEEKAGAAGVIVVRPGLAHDDARPGGVVGALSKLIDVAPVVPLVGDGRQVLYPCHSEDLARLVCALCAEQPQVNGPISAACRKGWYFRDILLAIAASKNKKPVLLPVPSALLTGGLRLVEFFGLKTRLRRDSLVSLINQNPNVDFTQLNSLGVTFRDFEF